MANKNYGTSFLTDISITNALFEAKRKNKPLLLFKWEYEYLVSKNKIEEKNGKKFYKKHEIIIGE